MLTYVEQGVADVGITGKDTILEYGAGMSFYERLDLKIGLCRTMTAAPAGFYPSTGVLGGLKFVNIARSYYHGQNCQVELIKLSGAMEIAPVLGLADCIVDIVDTGNTLRANGLEERELICDQHPSDCEPPSMKTKFAERCKTSLRDYREVVA